MTDLNFQLLHAVSAGFNFVDACNRLLDFCMKHTGATAGCCLRSAYAPGYYVVLATKGLLLRQGLAATAMVKLKPEHVATTEICEDAAGLVFQGTCCSANVQAGSLDRDPHGALMRLEWDDILRVPWEKVVELREACTHLGPVFRRLEQLDSRVAQLQRLRGAPVSGPVDKDLDEHKLDRLLPHIARLIVTRCEAEGACVLVGDGRSLVLEPNAFVGVTPEKLPMEFPAVNAAADLAKRLFAGHGALIEEPVLIRDEPVALVVAAAKAEGALGVSAREAIKAIAEEVRPFLWKAVLYRRTKAENPEKPLLMVGVPREILEAAERFGGSKATVLITGESGTGKEALARFIHLTSDRAAAPFVTVNAAEIQETLAESQLFGHKKGAFTGAVSDAPGAFEQAHGGTLFLDEIDHLNINVQAKVLRAIEYGEIRPLGARDGKRVDVRIICATNKNLPAEVDRGKFLQDLYLRINVFEIAPPPLRANKEMIPRIAGAIASELAEREGRRMMAFTPRTLKLLQTYDFPGNIRELRNIVQNALVSATGSQVDVEALPSRLLGKVEEKRIEPEFEYEHSKAEFERNYLVRLLKHARGNMTQAASISGLDRSHLYRMLRKHGLTPDDVMKS